MLLFKVPSITMVDRNGTKFAPLDTTYIGHMRRRIGDRFSVIYVLSFVFGNKIPSRLFNHLTRVGSGYPAARAPIRISTEVRNSFIQL